MASLKCIRAARELIETVHDNKCGAARSLHRIVARCNTTTDHLVLRRAEDMYIARCTGLRGVSKRRPKRRRSRR